MGYRNELAGIWGGHVWRRFVQRAVDHLQPAGKHLLELGYRDGTLACLLAALGARVTGLEVDPRCPARANATAERWRVADRVDFRLYDGDLRKIDGRYDGVITKSTLVLLGLHEALDDIRAVLNRGARFAFIENALGSLPMQALRYCYWLRTHRNYSNVHYLTEQHIGLIRERLHIDHVERSVLPPVYLICGHG